ncbi:MAG: hypothetical protein ACXADL_17195 [Candidatus Thorarchaeota archaeon]
MATRHPITVSNPRVLDFFSKHQNLDPEQTFLSFVDIMEKLSDSANNTVNNTLVESFLRNMQNINERMNTMDSNILSLRNDTISNFSQQMHEFKKDYMENLRLSLTSNVSEKIEPLGKEQMQILLERTTTMLNDTLPKNNTALQESVKTTMSSFKDDIDGNANKLLQNTVTAESLETFIASIQDTFSRTVVDSQQALATSLASTERHLDGQVSVIRQSVGDQVASTNALATSVDSLVGKFQNSSAKGAISENILLSVLHSLYSTAGIDHVGQQKETGDIMLTRPDKPKILIENKNWTRNASQDEVKKFIRDIELQKCCGIFLSQNCGIANKENYEINIHDGNVLCYVHEVDNDRDKIKIAIDIVDHFKAKIDELNADVDTDADTIPKEKLDAINTELQFLINTKLSLISTTKDYTQKMLKQLEELKIPTLEDYLSSRYATSTSKFLCEHCGFVAKNKAALAAHKRRCKSKPTDPSQKTLQEVTNQKLVIDLA